MYQKIDLQRVLSSPNKNIPITTLYVSVDISKQNRKKHIVEFKKMVRYKKQTTYFRELDEEARDSVLADFQRIEEWLETEFIPGTYISAVCFSSTGNDIWETILLRPQLKNTLVVHARPYIRPLTEVISDYRPFMLVLIDRAKARLFESFLGEYEELYSVHEESVTANVVRGGFFGTEERRSERKLQENVSHHYKNVAQKLFELYRQKKYDWLIIGGRKDVIAEFERHLHSYIQQIIQGRVYVEPNAPLNEVLEKVQESLHQAHRKFERQILNYLGDKINTNGSAVVGPDATIRVVLNNQAERLLIEEGFVRKGVVCNNCFYVGLKVEERCPRCGGKLERTNDIVNQLVDHAFSQNCLVDYIKSDMTEFGKIAAFLYYPIGGKR